MATNRSVTIGSVDVQPTDIVRNLGVLLDSELTMKQHVNKVASACFYYLHRLRQLKRHVSQDTLRQLVSLSAFILNRLDYCNSLLYGLPWSTIAPLQRIQNAAARLVLGLSPRDHVSSALQTLHWLPIGPFITRSSSRLRCSCTMHSLACVQSTLRTSLHLLPVTPVDSNYDLPPDPMSLFLDAEQSSAVELSQ